MLGTRLILACMTMVTGLIADFVPSFRSEQPHDLEIIYGLTMTSPVFRLLKRVLLIAALPVSVLFKSSWQ